jgi:hypothetical protein
MQSEEPTTCLPQQGDYLECLHHRKEVRRSLPISRKSNITDVFKHPTTPRFSQKLQIKRMQIIQAVQQEKQRKADQELAKQAAEHPPAS